MTLRPPHQALLISGAVLFLIGLLQGAAVQSFANPRMALSAHLTAVQSGTAIMVAGLAWSSAALGPAMATLARSTNAVGMYGLWVGLTVAAATGASASLPLAGAGFRAQHTVEVAVSAIIIVSSVAMTVGWTLLVLGLIRSKRD